MSNLSSSFPLLLLVDFFQCKFIAGFRNSFQGYKTTFRDTGGYQKTGTKGYWNTGVLEGISQLVSDFIETSRNFNLDFLHKNTASNCAQSKSTVPIFKAYEGTVHKVTDTKLVIRMFFYITLSLKFYITISFVFSIKALYSRSMLHYDNIDNAIFSQRIR
jgi:hypothetical protein